jgi:hypothetical protein
MFILKNLNIEAKQKPQPLCENWNEKGIGEKGNVATG